MAKPRFLFQRIRQHNDHEAAIRTHLGSGQIDVMIFSVAFVREGGVRQIQNFLSKHNLQTTVYVGIRNGITSAQGLLALLDLKVKVYTFDTGSASTIFHPKAYISFNGKEGRVIIGSANLTVGGLLQNIEASIVLTIDRQDTDDEKFLNDLVSSITGLQGSFPEHVVRVRRKSDVGRLLRQRRIEDERITQPQRSPSQIQGNNRDLLPRIKLFGKQRQTTIRLLKRKLISRAQPLGGWRLVWTSNGLTKRDLNIPTGATTNPTGSMLLKKGKLQSIDQRSHFRQTIFSSLTWKRDPRPSLNHLERAEATFEITVKGVNLGKYPLKLTHNSSTNTKTYKQLNAMTQIHWGAVKRLIAHSDLLGRELQLHQRNDDPQQFLIEID